MSEKQLLPHQQRVVEERNELVDKVTKLHSFFNTEIFESLPGEDQELLVKQEKVMKEYSDILLDRIKRF